MRWRNRTIKVSKYEAVFRTAARALWNEVEVPRARARNAQPCICKNTSTIPRNTEWRGFQYDNEYIQGSKLLALSLSEAIAEERS